MTSAGIPRFISLPVLEGGVLQLDMLGGPMIAPSGPAPAPVSRSAPRARGSARPMRDTSGPLWGDLSPSAGLQSSLASRLRARLGGDGSPEYGLIWKAWAIGSGPPICALRASGRRTSANACSGWPTPNAGPQNDGDSTWEARRARIKAERKNGNGFGMTLGMAAQTAGWATPTTRDHKSGATDLTNSMVRKDGKLRNDLLDYQAAMAGWNTPRATDGTHGGPNQTGGALPADAAVAGWATPLANDATGSQYHGNHANLKLPGMARAGSPAATGKRGALNPALSLWLMGFPSDWLMAAPSKRPRGRGSSKGSATPSSPKSPPRS